MNSLAQDVSIEECVDFLRAADPGVLLASLATITGDETWLSPSMYELAYGEGMQEGAAAITYTRPPGTSVELGARAAQVVTQLLDQPLSSALATAPAPSDELLLKAMRIVTMGDPGRAYLGRLRQDLGLDTSAEDAVSRLPVREGFRVVVVGMGVGGITMARKLKRAGIPFTAIEKNAEVGGVWLENKYPDCGVDTDCGLYSFSDEPLDGWTRHYARRDEILQHARDYVHKHGLYEDIQFGLEVTSAVWDATSSEWVVTATSQEGSREFRANVLVTAVGSLNRPFIPQIPGLSNFQGPVFHTATWPSDFDLTGRDIALVGNGSSGVQVGKSIAARARSLTAFQRTPHWIKPHPRQAMPVSDGERRAFQRIPYYAEWYRFLISWVEGDSVYANITVDPDWQGPGVSERNEQARKELTQYIRDEVGDRPDLVEKLVPDYPPYYKRMVLDNGWYRTLAKPNVRLVTERIVECTPSGVKTSDGTEHALDAIIFATGFHGTKFLWPMEIRGREGRTPSEVFGGDDELRAYMGTAMPGFPNMFSILGPNSLVGHGGSGVGIADMQSHYILLCLKRVLEEDLTEVECLESACTSYNEKLDSDMASMVWSAADAPSRYKSGTGRVEATHPWTLQRFWELTQDVDWSAYQVK